MILDQLPPSSRYVWAKKNDPEIAMHVARTRREQQRTTGRAPAYRPPASEWNMVAELLASILDRQGEQVALLADLPIAGKKRKHKPPKRTARPVTAIERAEQQLALEHYESIVADVEAAKVSHARYAEIAAEAAAQRGAADGGKG